MGVCTFASTILGVMLVMNSLSVYMLPPPDVPVTLTVHQESTRLLIHLYLNSDALFLNFDLSIDLSSVFNWNTKHVFVYIVAEYETENSVKNQVVVWDQLIQTKDKSKLDLENVNVEYPLLDNGTGLRKNQITFQVQWSVSPQVGLIYDSIPDHFALTKPVT